ncbi:MAG TPA: hypothetical protein VFP59_16410 [Candidatus Angelobacter sp.]|nr:hypothetical protein [Candidatus Angelobacter sp.]
MGKQVMLFLVLLMLGVGVPGRAQTTDNSLQQKGSTATDQDTTKTAGQKQGQNAAPSATDKESKPAKRKTHIRLGGVTLGAGYSNFGNSFIPPFYPYYPYYGYGVLPVRAFYTPFAVDMLYGPFYYPPRTFDLNYALGKGEVELKSLGRNKNASVYIDDAYAGKAGKLKHLWLDSGAYDLSLTGADGSSFHQRIYVLSGKKLKITPEFKMSGPAPQNNAPQNEEKR